jgi:hypothetical protein
MGSEYDVFLFGRHSIGPWLNEEIKVFLDKVARTRDDFRGILSCFLVVDILVSPFCARLISSMSLSIQVHPRLFPRAVDAEHDEIRLFVPIKNPVLLLTAGALCAKYTSTARSVFFFGAPI